MSGTAALFTVVFPSGAFIRSGTGDPESSITAVVGSLWLRTDLSGTACLYVKESGTGNTGWVVK